MGKVGDWEQVSFPPVASRQMPDQFQHGGQTRKLNMAAETTSKPEKKEIFKDVRFFLAEENNEEVCFKLWNAENSAISDEG